MRIHTDQICGVCQTALSTDEPMLLCPECRLPHHAECWEANLGCSAYGCSQVHVLKAGPDIVIERPAGAGRHDQRADGDFRSSLNPALAPAFDGAGPESNGHFDGRESSLIPLEHLHLLASVICFPLGIFVTPLMPLAVGALALLRLKMDPSKSTVPPAVPERLRQLAMAPPQRAPLIAAFIISVLSLGIGLFAGDSQQSDLREIPLTFPQQSRGRSPHQRPQELYE